MCKYKNLTKPNHWRIMLFLDNKKILIPNQEKNISKVKSRYTVDELSRELNIPKNHLREYLKELEELGEVNTCKLKGRIEVIL